MWAWITVATSTPSQGEDVGFNFYAIPYGAMIACVPLWLTAVVLAAVALARHEPARAWSIALLVLNVVGVPALLLGYGVALPWVLALFR